ncbi:hypothetical protein ACW73I_09170 [Methylomonas sp. MgM2]
MAEKYETNKDAVINITTVKDFVALYPDLFTERQINWLIKTRNKNGLQQFDAILKVGRRLYIDKTNFLNWFLSQREKR